MPPLVRSSTSPGYALALLTAAYAVNQLDRQSLSLLLEKIKDEFQVSDTILALVSGIGFATLFVLCSLSFARWADRGTRIVIVAGGLAFYSAMTLLTGFSQNFLQLAATRVGVAVGEATGIAPSTSILSDLFPIRTRGSAMSIFSAGGLLATLFMFPLLGWIATTFSWRAAFLAAGLPGLALAALIWRTLHEPPRGASETGSTDRVLEPLGDTIRFLLGQRSVMLTYASACFSSWTLYCFVVWTPTFLARVHHLSPLQIGWICGSLYSGAGIVGGVTGGYFSDGLGRRDPKWRLMGPGLVALLGFPFGITFLFSSNTRLMLTALAALSFVTLFPIGAVWAALQSAVKVRMRALNSSIYNAFWMLAGLGLGTLCVGMLSDHLHARFGQAAIRYSLVAPLAMQLVGGPLLAAAGLYLARDLRRVEQAKD